MLRLSQTNLFIYHKKQEQVLFLQHQIHVLRSIIITMERYVKIEVSGYNQMENMQNLNISF